MIIMIKEITAKLGNMRKSAEFVVYPGDPLSNYITIQSDNRICMFNKHTGAGLLSNGKGGHQGIAKLDTHAGAMKITVPQDVIDAAIAAQPKKGDEIGPGVTIG